MAFWNPRLKLMPDVPSKAIPIALGLGANLATPEQMIAHAIKLLKGAGVTVNAVAPLIQTVPVDCVPGTPDFTNTALIGSCALSPEELLNCTQAIERQIGRPERHSSHEARIIDIDILLYGSDVLATPHLTIPHPRLHLRDFALAPLAAIAPDWIIPTRGCTVKEALSRLTMSADIISDTLCSP